MRNPFKKYGHRKTRYDEMKEFDRKLKIELALKNYNKWYKKSTVNITDKSFFDTQLGEPWHYPIIIPGNNQFEKLSVQKWTEKYRIKTGNLQKAIKRISITAKQATENMQKAVNAMNKLSHPS